MKSQRGSAMIEFAIGWSLLWLLFSGVYQFGYCLYAYNVLATSVANAAGYGSRLSYDSSNPAAFSERLKNMVVFGDDAQGSRPLLPQLLPGSVDVNLTMDPNGVPRDVTVSVNYRIEAIFTTFELKDKPRVTVAYRGRITCSTC